MDILEDEENDPNFYIAVFGVLSFVCIMLIVVLIYVVCARKYRLNWFEKTLLEASDVNELTNSQEALVVEETSPKTSKPTNLSGTDNNKFWIPSPVIRNISTYQSEHGDSTTGESTPASPTSSCSCQLPYPTGSTAIARSDQQIVLTTGSPGKPRIPTMHSKLDHTKINTSFYQKESPEEPEDVRGSIHVTLSFDPLAGILAVRLVEAQDLRARDFSGTACPYAKIRLLPDRTNVWQTRIHKKTLNPVFDEDFVFEVRAAVLGRYCLEILLYDFDAYTRHQCIGGAQFSLASIDLNEKADVWRTVRPMVNQDPKVDLGELMVSLQYLPSAERLTIIVIKARNLRIVDDTRNSSDPYVKICLVHGNKRIKKKKTSVHRNTVCPVINEALTFDVDKETLKNCTIEFYAIHDSLLGTNEKLGTSKINRQPSCGQEEREFFLEMLHSTAATAQWLTLSDTASA